MNKPFRLVVFDWEGTVGDTLGEVLNRIAIEAELLGFGSVDPYKVRQYVSLGLVASLRKLFPHLAIEQQEQLLHAVQHSLMVRPNEVCLIPGVEAFIQRLCAQQINVAVATNKGHHSLARVLHVSGLDKVFKVTRSAGQVPAKPCPQMLEEIMEAFHADSSSTLMIGDSIADMEMAKKMNVTAIGVDFYHQQESALKAAGAEAVFDDYQVLADYLGLPK